MQVGQEGMTFPVGNQEHSLLRSNTFHFIVLNDKLFLENLDGEQSPRTLRFCEHDLTKIALTQNSKEVEVIEADSLARPSIRSQR